MMQWMSLTEEVIFLVDGSLHLSDLLRPPEHNPLSQEFDRQIQQLVSTSEGMDAAALSTKLKEICRFGQGGIGQLQTDYQLQALGGLWAAREQCLRVQRERNAKELNKTAANKAKEIEMSAETVRSRMSMMLLFPLLQSQSKMDSSLCEVTTRLLTDFLRTCPPMSIEDADGSLVGLEDMLIHWIREGKMDRERMRETACSLVALACAKQSLLTVVRAIKILKEIADAAEDLPVLDLLTQFEQLEGGKREPNVVLGSHHVRSWKFNSDIKIGEESVAVAGDEMGKSSLASCGKYLFTTNCEGCGISKVGTGYNLTVRGHVYVKNEDVPSGLLAFGNDYLVHRSKSYDGTRNLVTLFNKNTLEQEETLSEPAELALEGAQTVHLISNGSEFYWIRSFVVPEEQRPIAKAGSIIFVDKFYIHDRKVNEMTERKFMEKLEETEQSKEAIFKAILSKTVTTNEGEAAQSPAGPIDPHSTTMRLSDKLIDSCPFWTCGHSLSLLTTVHAVASPASGNVSASGAVSRTVFGSSVGIAAASAKPLAATWSYDLKSCQFTNRAEMTEASTSNLNKGASLYTLTATYDPWNNAIWTAGGDWVDEYRCPGLPAVSHIKKRLGLDSTQSKRARQQPETKNMAAVQDILAAFVQHVGIHSQYCTTSAALRERAGASAAEDEMLRLATELFASFLDRSGGGETPQAMCMLSLVGMILHSNKGGGGIDPAVSGSLQERLQKLMTETKEADVLKLVAAVLDCLWAREGGRKSTADRIAEMLKAGLSGQLGCCLMEDTIQREINDLRSLAGPAAVTERLGDLSLVKLALERMTEQEKMLMNSMATMDQAACKNLVAELPRLSVLQKYIIAVVFKLAHGVTKGDPYPPSKAMFVEVARCVVAKSLSLVHTFMSATDRLSDEFDGEEAEIRLLGIQKLAMGTSLGTVLSSILTCMTHETFLDLHTVHKGITNLVQLLIDSRRAAYGLKTAIDAVRASDRDECDDDDDGDLQTQLEAKLKGVELKIDREEPGFMHGLPLPPLVECGKVLETPHPMRDNYKYRESINLPGASHVYLLFDHRCATQYDYDKLSIHAGKTTNAKKVYEFGGNSYGFGSKSVLGNGWPKECLKIEGDSVTLSFEMRSGREQNVPDKVLWGFKIFVRPMEIAETSAPFPFFANLSILLSSLTTKHLSIMFDGCKISNEEQECETLLQSKLLQRCIWKASTRPSENEEEDIEIPAAGDLARIKLPQETLKRLMDLSGTKSVPIRASAREVLKPGRIEEGIISSVIKHLSFSDAVSNLTLLEKENSPEYCLLVDVITETYQKLHALIRRLQVLADLESQWINEVDDVKSGLVLLQDVFFDEYQHHESKAKELALLCFLKEVKIEKDNLQRATNDLKATLEMETRVCRDDGKILPITTIIVGGVIERIELLLHVSIKTGLDTRKNDSNIMTRSLQCWPADKGRRRIMTKQQSMEIERSLDDSILQIPKLKKSARKMRSARSVIEDLSSLGSHGDKEPESIVLDQLFSFIGSHPEKAIPASSFLKSVMERRRRSRGRIQSLALMRQLLMTTDVVGGSSLIFSSICQILQRGPRTEELTCGSLVPQAREVFSDTLTSLVKIATSYPLSCKPGICQMCIIPYSKKEEGCLVQSGLVRLLDQLCGLHDISADDVEVENQSSRQKLSQTAWVAFKILANRCVEWEETEEEETGSSAAVPSSSSGLAQQVSVLLTNHLIQASKSNERPINCAALQEVLTLLTSLSRSKLGKEILSQSVCVSKLLSLLLEPRLSPKMILTIACLCHVALPLMSESSCKQVVLPNWKIGTHTSKKDNKHSSNAKKIVDLLITKIADFSVPGCQAHVSTSALQTPAADNVSNLQKMQESLSSSSLIAVSSSEQVPDTTMSLFVHKRSEQNAQELIQQLLAINHDVRLFRQAGTGDNMEKVVKMDKELTKTNKAEVAMEDATLVFRKAMKLAQQGFVVSLGPAQKMDEMSEQKKLAVEQLCKERNTILAKFDPQRPFISSQVANSLAAELISLLQSLLKSESAGVWTTAIFDVMTAALKKFQSYVKLSDRLFTASKSELCDIFTSGRDILACFATLGSFSESLKPGVKVRVLGQGMSDQIGIVCSTDPYTQTAQVDFVDVTGESQIWSFPISRLVIDNPLEAEAVALFIPLLNEIVDAVQGFLIPDANGTDHLSEGLPASGDGNNLKLRTSRLFAEIRTSACKLLSVYLSEPAFACRFLQKSCYAVDMLKCLTKDCLPSDRKALVAANCEKLRSVYRDCVKPPPPPSPNGNKEKDQHNVWNASQTFPPLQSLVLTHGLLGLTYYAEPVMAAGLPRGIILYAEKPVSAKDCSYFEVNILSFGSTNDDSSSPLLSIGIAPIAEKAEGSWTNPVGTLLFHNNGRVVHYNGTSLLQWKSLRFDRQFYPGDTIGIGLEDVGEDGKGTAYFTHNGTRLGQELEAVDSALYPAAHIQKKEIRIRANFGQSDFMYKDAPRAGVHASLSLTFSEAPSPEPNVFEALPFGLLEDNSPEEEEAEEKGGYNLSAGHRRYNPYPCRPALKQKSLPKYDPGTIISHRLQKSGNPLFKSGQRSVAMIELDEDSDGDDEDEEDESDNSIEPAENVNSLLVKIWEHRVFPIIRRRFRNETERREGLEQIKGALSFGMPDIARQTVEFLYEENGGIPNDLVLPTIDDVKEEMSKFTIDKIRKGDMVSLKEPTQAQDPNFSSLAQVKTFGLQGEVLEVDRANELIQVETYLRGDGVLVRFWYPLSWLEKPNDSRQRKTTITGLHSVDVHNSNVHKELLNAEFALSRMFCRDAYLHLVQHSRNADLTSCLPPENKPNSSMMAMLTSSIMLLQDIDVENIQYISNSNLRANKTAGGTVVLNCSTLECSTDQLWSVGQGNLLDIVYANDKQMKTEMQRIIARVCFSQSDDGEEHLMELSDQLCVCLQHTSDFFHSEEIVINDISTLRALINFKEASFVTLATKLNTQLGPSYPPGLQIQVKVMEGPDVKKNGQNSAKDVTQIPFPTGGGSNDSHIRAFPELVLATDTICISQSGGGDQDVTLVIHDIPQQLPMAMCFIEEAVKSKVMPAAVLFHLAEHLASFLSKCDSIPMVKSSVFLFMAKLLKSYQDKMELSDKPLQTLPQTNLFRSLRSEVLKLQAMESKSQPPRFSSYFQSLFELMRLVQKGWKDQIKGASTADDGQRTRQEDGPRTEAGTEAPKAQQDCLDKANAAFDLLFATLKTNSPELSQKAVLISDRLSATNHQRLLILHGLPDHVNAKQINEVLNKAFEPFGGLFKSDVFIHQVNTHATVVIETRAQCKMEKAKKAIEKQNPFAIFSHQSGAAAALEVETVNADFGTTGGVECKKALHAYLKKKLLSEELNDVLTDVFQSTFCATCCCLDEGCSDSPIIRLGKEEIMQENVDNQMLLFFNSLNNPNSEGTVDFVSRMLEKYGTVTTETWTKAAPGAEATRPAASLSLDEFVKLAHDQGEKEIERLALAVGECGYNMHLIRVATTGAPGFDNWTREQNVALTSLINETAFRLGVSPGEIHPSEIFLSKENGDMKEYHCLNDAPQENISCQAALLQVTNLEVEKMLPMVRLSLSEDKMTSTAALLSQSRHLLFAGMKENFLRKQIDESALRPPDQIAPEITLDPLEIIGKGADEVTSTWFYQAMMQLNETPSDLLCVPIAHGGDPQFSFNVKMRGVEGTSGSFRHFLGRATEELHSQALSLLLPYLGGGQYKGRYVLKPGAMSVRDEKLLMFFGQLLGISMRAGIPLVLNLVPIFWKSLLGQGSFNANDLRTYDPITMNYLEELLAVQGELAFEQFMEEHQYPKFTFLSMSGDEEEIAPNGAATYLTYQTRQDYAAKVKEFKLSELSCDNRLRRIQIGLGTVVPVDTIMTLFTPEEMEALVCGFDHVLPLSYLRGNTIYQAGLTDNDEHIQFFWLALESFTAKQMQQFLKFACNQDRVPATAPPGPPFPMKIAPASGREGVEPDAMHIRVETCMFMVKLPAYSSYELLRERILFAMNSADDPLSG